MAVIQTDELLVGQRGIYSMSFTVNGGPATPSLVSFRILQPDSTVVDVEVVGSSDQRVSTFDPPMPGWYVGRIEASGGGVQDAEEFRFYVRAQSVPDA